MRYFGPFRILQKIGAVACGLELPETARIHSIFHVSLLKIFKGDSTTPYMPLPLQSELEGPVLQPFKVFASRTIVKGSLSIPQVMIQRENTEPHEGNWESVADMQEAYLTFNLRDKVILNRGNVMCNTKNDSKHVKVGNREQRGNKISKESVTE